MKSIYGNLVIKYEDEMVNISTNSFEKKKKNEMDYYFLHIILLLVICLFCY